MILSLPTLSLPILILGRAISIHPICAAFAFGHDFSASSSALRSSYTLLNSAFGSP
jgi:hypothetical protein